MIKPTDQAHVNKKIPFFPKNLGTLFSFPIIAERSPGRSRQLDFISPLPLLDHACQNSVDETTLSRSQRPFVLHLFVYATHTQGGDETQSANPAVTAGPTTGYFVYTLSK